MFASSVSRIASSFPPSSQIIAAIKHTVLSVCYGFAAVLAHFANLAAIYAPAIVYIILPIIFLLTFAYIKIQYPFWSRQPVYHTYDVWRWFSMTSAKPQIIDDRPLAESKTKFYSPHDVRTQTNTDITPELADTIATFMRNYYLCKTDTALYTLTGEQLMAQMAGCDGAGYITRHTGCGGEATAIAAVLASKPTTIFFFNRQTATYDEYVAQYWFGLTVANYLDETKKRDHTRKLIQTHHYNVRLAGGECIAIFKKDTCDGVVPFFTYTSHLFNRKILARVPLLQPPLRILQINATNIKLLDDFFTLIKENPHLNLDIIMMPSVANILAMLRTRQLFIYCLVLKEVIYSVYVFRNPFILLDSGGGEAATATTTTSTTAATTTTPSITKIDSTNVLECVASVFNMQDKATISDEHITQPYSPESPESPESESNLNKLFYAGFLHSLNQCCRDTHLKIALFKIHDVAHNWRIIDEINKNNPSGAAKTPTTKMGVYLYNLFVAGSPRNSHNIFLLD